MLTGLILSLLMIPQTAAVPAGQGSAAQADTNSMAVPADDAALASEDELKLEQKLLHVKRIYVDTLGDDAVAKQMQDMIISGLSGSKRFIVTENRERADAVLKGSGLEKSSQEYHSSSEGTAISGAAGHHSGNVSGSFSDGSGSVSGSSSGGFHASGARISDSSASTETIHEARAAVRLVDKDGDVIWSTTQESKGAKYKGSSADAADKIVKQLLWDIEKLEKRNKAAPTRQTQ